MEIEVSRIERELADRWLDGDSEAGTLLANQWSETSDPPEALARFLRWCNATGRERRVIEAYEGDG